MISSPQACAFHQIYFAAHRLTAYVSVVLWVFLWRWTACANFCGTLDRPLRNSSDYPTREQQQHSLCRSLDKVREHSLLRLNYLALQLDYYCSLVFLAQPPEKNFPLFFFGILFALVCCCALARPYDAKRRRQNDTFALFDKNAPRVAQIVVVAHLIVEPVDTIEP